MSVCMYVETYNYVKHSKLIIRMATTCKRVAVNMYVYGGGEVNL